MNVFGMRITSFHVFVDSCPTNIYLQSLIPPLLFINKHYRTLLLLLLPLFTYSVWFCDCSEVLR